MGREVSSALLCSGPRPSGGPEESPGQTSSHEAKPANLSAAISLQRGSPARPAGRKAAKAADLTKEFSITFTCAWCKKGKQGGREPLRNPKRKSLTNPRRREKNQPQICLRCSQIAVLKSSASLSSSSSHPSNCPKKASNFALICASVAGTKQNVTAAPSPPLPLAAQQLRFLKGLMEPFLCHHPLFFPRPTGAAPGRGSREGEPGRGQRPGSRTPVGQSNSSSAPGEPGKAGSEDRTTQS